MSETNSATRTHPIGLRAAAYGSCTAPRDPVPSDRLFVVDTTLPYRLLSAASIFMAYANLYDGNQVASRQREGQEEWQTRRMEFKAVVLFHTIL